MLRVESLLSSIPVGADPYDYIKHSLLQWGSVPLCRATLVSLVVILILHAFIAATCLLLLTLPCIRPLKRSPWYLKKLYIEDHSSGKAHQVPLYFANAGVLLTTSQLLSSASTSAFIWFDIGAASPGEHLFGSRALPAVGLMNLAEILAYWSLSHCFLVITICHGNKKQQEKSMSSIRHIPPQVINFIFTFVPIAAMVITIFVIAWVTSVTSEIQSYMKQGLMALDQGSSIWKQLQATPQSLEAQAQLRGITMQLANLFRNAFPRLEVAFHRFRLGECLFLSFESVSCPIFVASFWILVQNYLKQSPNSTIKSCSSGGSMTHMNTGTESGTRTNTHSVVASRSYLDAIKTDRQFFHLNIRALGTFISMLLNIILHMVNISRTTDALTVPYWRTVATLLGTVGSIFSGIPVVWQCWRLHVDQSDATADCSNRYALAVVKARESHVPLDASGARGLKVPVTIHFEHSDTLVAPKPEMT
ncbi:hypothetical protein PGT21_033567 [Puccinia graminis f. sp. tritici]|uniref:Uncharacterized protein n=1 Tax=Puccinia graminis f. sp. tritici TaxID=56615 RepID=A0A5B0LZ85_PUCGR|nr:hypothetical protein PGT21_033567 [Puccinia graminis f. sp. tritici]